LSIKTGITEYEIFGYYSADLKQWLSIALPPCGTGSALARGRKLEMMIVLTAFLFFLNKNYDKTE
jgi:hypothetical protein